MPTTAATTVIAPQRETCMPILLSSVGVVSAAAGQRSEIRHEIGHFLAAERRPPPPLVPRTWIVDQRMVPERGQHARRCVQILRGREIAGRLAALAMERVAVQAALVDGQEDA